MGFAIGSSVNLAKISVRIANFHQVQGDEIVLRHPFG